MTSPLASAAAPFGRLLTAMVTPFDADGALDLDSAQRLASRLVDDGSDGLVITGTTGESPTTTGAEDAQLLEAVLEAVGDRATVVAGVGTNDTRHSVELTKEAARLGAHGLLLVNPYYSKPPQAGIIAHTDAVIAAGDGIPVMLYDIPGRSGVALSRDTYLAMNDRPSVVAVKDAVADFAQGAWLKANTDLAIYSGDDALTLPWLAVGAVGAVSVVSHVAAPQIKAMIEAVDAGDLARAQELNAGLIDLIDAIMGQTQGAIAAKAAVHALGRITHATVRLPLVSATDDQVARIRAALTGAGIA